jgi:hypothetical protein
MAVLQTVSIAPAANPIGVTATDADLNATSTILDSFSFVAASAASNVCEVTVTALDPDAATLAEPVVFDIWLSDASTGAGLTGTTTSGTVTVKSASGAVLVTGTAKKHLQVQALATGIFTLEITDTAKTTFYVCAKNGNGGVDVSTILATGDYGA